MKKSILFSALFLATGLFANAQTSVTVSTDAPSIYFGGYSLEGGFNLNTIRFSVALDQLEVPSFINPDYDSIQAFRKGLNLKVSKFLRDDQSGLHYGLSTGFVFGEELSAIDSAGDIIASIPSISQSYITVGVQAGYFLFPFKNSEKFKGFYIEPSIGLTYALDKDDLLLGNKLVEKKPIAIAPPRLNIGWKFEI